MRSFLLDQRWSCAQSYRAVFQLEEEFALVRWLAASAMRPSSAVIALRTPGAHSIYYIAVQIQAVATAVKNSWATEAKL
jgi:hypothetical protein